MNKDYQGNQSNTGHIDVFYRERLHQGGYTRAEYWSMKVFTKQLFLRTGCRPICYNQWKPRSFCAYDRQGSIICVLASFLLVRQNSKYSMYVCRIKLFILLWMRCGLKRLNLEASCLKEQLSIKTPKTNPCIWQFLIHSSYKRFLSVL